MAVVFLLVDEYLSGEVDENRKKQFNNKLRF